VFTFPHLISRDWGRGKIMLTVPMVVMVMVILIMVMSEREIVLLPIRVFCGWAQKLNWHKTPSQEKST
jgi:predicted MFS family arabinose efflux permease